jgi:hypothetical protein
MSVALVAGSRPGVLPDWAVVVALVAVAPGVGWLLSRFVLGLVVTFWHGVLRVILATVFALATVSAYAEPGTNDDPCAEYARDESTQSAAYERCKLPERLVFAGSAGLLAAIPLASAAALAYTTRRSRDSTL